MRLGKVEIEGALGDEDPPRPVLEVEAGERADPGNGDVGLAGLTGGTDVNEGGIEREALRFMDGERVGQAQGQLLEPGGTRVV